MYQQAKSLTVGLVALALMGCGRATPVSAARLPVANWAARTASATLEPGAVRADAVYQSSFQLGTTGEVWLSLHLVAPQAEWGTKGREAAAATLWVDGKAQQDVLVPGGPMRAQSLFLGSLGPGEHQLKLSLHPKSTPGAGGLVVGGGSLGLIAPGDPRFEALAHAPIVTTRDDALRSDMPLAMYHEVKPEADGGKRIRYTAIISNEDLGTDTKALFARWGRGVDIDWTYEVRIGPDGKRQSGTYQGLFHWTKNYGGRLEGQHPTLRINTPNNTYTDGGEGSFRLRLDPSMGLDEAQSPREASLDRLPWVFPLMAQELFRENKARQDKPLDQSEPLPQGGPEVGDPRRFLFVDLKLAHQGRNVAVGVLLQGEANWRRSDRFDDGLTVNRGGWVRTAIELPRKPRFEDLQSLAVFGVGGKNSSQVLALGQVMCLDEAFKPVVWPLKWAGPPAHLPNGGAKALLYQAPSEAPGLPLPGLPLPPAAPVTAPDQPKP